MNNPGIVDIRQAFRSGAVEERQTITIAGFHQAGVLVPIVPTAAGLHLLLTKRTEDVETHKGQISFPGGMVDPTDESIVQTALREAKEELGIEPSAVEAIGILSDIATPTGFVITPVVGIIEQLPELTPSAEEVAEVIHVPLELFMNGRNARMELREWRGKQHEVWYYQFGEHLIWGATAIITRSLLKKLGLAGQP